MSAPLADAVGVIDRAPVTAWLLQVLTATGLPAGDNQVPTVSQWPLLIVWDIPGGQVWGPPLTGVEACVGLVYQVDAVGLRPDQARAAGDRARRAVLGRAAGGGWRVVPSDPEGLTVVHRELAGGAGDGVDAEGVEPNQRWTAHQRFTVHVEEA